MAELPKLRRDTKITENGLPTLSYHQWWDKLSRSLTSDLTDMETAIASITVALEAINAALEETARITSYPVPTNVLTAADVGATATITVAAHARVYPVKGPLQIEDVTIATGTIANLPFSTKYFVYYDDTTLTNGTPTFLATTDPASAQVGYSGRHFLGEITTPTNGAGNTSGTGPRPPGGGGPLV